MSTGEAVSVVQGERLLAGKHRALELGKLVFQNAWPWRSVAPKRSSSAMIMTTLELAVLDDLGVHICPWANDLVDVVVEERTLDADAGAPS